MGPRGLERGAFPAQVDGPSVLRIRRVVSIIASHADAVGHRVTPVRARFGRRRRLAHLSELGGRLERPNVVRTTGVAPAGSVDAMETDRSTLPGEAQVGFDNRERAGFGETLKQRGRNDVDAAETESLDLRLWERAAKAVTGVRVGPAAEESCLIKKKRSGGGAGHGGECRERPGSNVRANQRTKVDVAEDIDVVDEKRPVIVEEPGRLLQSPAGVEKGGFAGEGGAQTEAVLSGEVAFDLLRKVVEVDDDVGHPGFAEAQKHVLEQGAALDLDECLGTVVSEWTEARPAAGGEDHRFHG
jgi:hypothetical protein